MTTQSEALRLADWLDGSSNGPMDAKHKAAAELRRLHEANQELLEALKAANELIGMEPFEHVAEESVDAHRQIRAAIAKAEGRA